MPVTATCRRGCGRCCDPVILGAPMTAYVEQQIAALNAGGATDVDSSIPFIRDHWVRRPGLAPDRVNAEFGGTAWDCDRYDPASGECLAHNDRPPVCSGFPWYAHGPNRDRITLDMVCTFHADLGRTVLPLTVLAREVAACPS